MLGVKIVCVGNLKEKYLKDAAAEYTKRLSRFCDLEITETPESTPEKEKDPLLKSIKGKTVALCVEGESMSSEELAKLISDTALGGKSEICFGLFLPQLQACF